MSAGKTRKQNRFFNKNLFRKERIHISEGKRKERKDPTKTSLKNNNNHIYISFHIIENLQYKKYVKHTENKLNYMKQRRQL